VSWLEWSAIAIAVVGLAIFGPRSFRLAFGYRCPACRRSRVRRVGSMCEFQVGLRLLWACPSCRSEFSQRNWGPLVATGQVPDVGRG